MARDGIPVRAVPRGQCHPAHPPRSTCTAPRAARQRLGRTRTPRVTQGKTVADDLPVD